MTKLKIRRLIPFVLAILCTKEHNKALGRGLYWNWAYVQLYLTKHFIGLAYQGKDIVFRFIIEYSSLMDFAPLGNRSIFI
jgi:hypothetical protein